MKERPRNIKEIVEYYRHQNVSIFTILDTLEGWGEKVSFDDVAQMYYQPNRQQTLEILGSLPTLNEYIAKVRTNKDAGFAMAKAATNKCMKACFSLQHYPDKVRLDVILNWHFTNRQTDPDNIFFGVKFILDGLVNSGKLKNDGCANVRNIFHQYSISKRKGVTVTLIEL